MLSSVNRGKGDIKGHTKWNRMRRGISKNPFQSDFIKTNKEKTDQPRTPEPAWVQGHNPIPCPEIFLPHPPVSIFFGSQTLSSLSVPSSPPHTHRPTEPSHPSVPGPPICIPKVQWLGTSATSPGPLTPPLHPPVLPCTPQLALLPDPPPPTPLWDHWQHRSLDLPC